MTVALTISTYNRPDALAVCLDSALAQTRMPDEIIVCDDGSGDETRQLVERYATLSPVPVKHVWHPDQGFRLAAIRNRGIAASTCDYILQIDGDIMMHPHFVADHIAVARKGYFVKGSRVRLTPTFTDTICASGRAHKVAIWSRGILKDREKAIRLGVAGRWFSHRYKLDTTSGIGCNMAYWRDDFIRVNGYDENFVGWGCEDIDLCARFVKAGLHNFKLYRIGIAYHLWHENEGNSNIEQSVAYMREKAMSDEFGCERGVKQYL